VAVALLGPAWGKRQLDGEASAQQRLVTASQDVDTVVRLHLLEETSLRGFVATRDPSYLQPPGPPDPAYPGRIAAAAQALRAAGAGEEVALLERIGATHARWEQHVALPLLRDPYQLDSYQLQIDGRNLTDALRADGARLRADLVAVSDRQQAQLRSTIDLTVWISVAVIALFAIAAVALGLARATALQRLERERALVEALQQTLRVGGSRLPHTDLGFAYVSATTDALIGGDLLDSWREGDAGGWFLIADVSGKGIQAARHAAFAQYAIRALSAEYTDPDVVVSRFNRLYIETFAEPSSFVVLFLGHFAGRTNVLRFVAAGHSTAFVRYRGNVEPLAPTGPIVGLELDSAFGVSEVALRVGATVLLATDGLTEARDAAGAFLGDDGVAALLASAPLDPQGICDFLVDVAERRCGGTIADDLAILAMRVLDREDASSTEFSTMEAAPRR
jgi:serine phosphatase RsbU (regulator of sigma subunit)